MLIFNLGGFLTAVLTFGSFFLLEPAIEDTPIMNYADIILTLIFFLYGVILEFLRLKPRIFFIPCWFLGIIGISVQSYKLWGWPSIIGAVIFIAISIKLLMVLSKNSELKKWANIKLDLSNYNQYKESASDEENRKKLLNCFFYNIHMDNSPEIFQHNTEVLQIVLSDFGNKFSSDEQDRINNFIADMERMSTENKFDFEERDSAKDIEALISEKLN